MPENKNNPQLDKLQSYISSFIKQFGTLILFLYKEINGFIVKYKYLFTAITIFLLSLFFFIIIGFPEITVYSIFFKQRTLGLAILSLIFLFTFLVVYYSKFSNYQKISYWLQSNILTFFSFAYFLRLNAAVVNFSNFNIDTRLVALPLSGFILYANYQLLTINQRKLTYLVPQIVIIAVQAYSFVNLIKLDRTSIRSFSYDWLALLFNLPGFIWFVVCALAITLVSLLSYKLKTKKQNLIFGLILFVLLFQALFAIDHIAGLSYWYKTFLFLVFWDFIYNPIYTISNQINDTKYQPKLVVSAIYHFVLIIALLIGRPIFG